MSRCFPRLTRRSAPYNVGDAKEGERALLNYMSDVLCR